MDSEPRKRPSPQATVKASVSRADKLSGNKECFDVEEVLGHQTWQCSQVLELLPWVLKEAVGYLSLLMIHGHGCQSSKNQAGTGQRLSIPP